MPSQDYLKLNHTTKSIVRMLLELWQAWCLPGKPEENFPWCFIPFPCVLLLVTRDQHTLPDPLHCSPWGRCRLQSGLSGHPSAFCKLSWASQGASAIPPKSCPWDLSPSWLPSSGHTRIVWCPSDIKVPKTAPSVECGAAPMQCRGGQSPPLMG